MPFRPEACGIRHGIKVPAIALEVPENVPEKALPCVSHT